MFLGHLLWNFDRYGSGSLLGRSTDRTGWNSIWRIEQHSGG